MGELQRLNRKLMADMNVKELIAKVLRGEALADAEKEHLSKYDPDAVAAAARKSEKERADRLEAEANTAKAEAARIKQEAESAGKTEAQKIADAIKANEAKIAALEKERDAERSARAAMVREQKENAVIGKVKLLPGVDPEIAKLALRHRLKDLKDEDLDTDAVAPIVADFVAKNKAIVQDESGSGTGSQNDGQKRSGFSGPTTDPSKQTDAERTKLLRKL